MNRIENNWNSSDFLRFSMLFIYNKYNKYIFLNFTSEDGYRALRGALWYGRFWLRGHHFQAESDGPGAGSNDKQ